MAQCSFLFLYSIFFKLEYFKKQICSGLNLVVDSLVASIDTRIYNKRDESWCILSGPGSD